MWESASEPLSAWEAKELTEPDVKWLTRVGSKKEPEGGKAQCWAGTKDAEDRRTEMKKKDAFRWVISELI